MNKVTALRVQITFLAASEVVCPPPAYNLPIDGVWECLVTKVLDCGPKQSMQKVIISFIKGSQQRLSLLPFVFPRCCIFFMSGIAIIALLLFT